MLIFHRNCIAYDDLEEEDLRKILTPAKSHDDGRCWWEVLDGDESIQRKLGDSYTWQELLNGDFSDGSDVIVAPTDLRDLMCFSLTALGFQAQPSVYSGEDRWFLNGKVLTLSRGRRPGFSPIYGKSGSMIKRNKSWSMAQKCWDWLESQPNQSEFLRNLIEDAMKKTE